jgi:hypothetical protein
VIVHHVYLEAERQLRIIGEPSRARTSRLHEWARQQIEARHRRRAHARHTLT